MSSIIEEVQNRRREVREQIRCVMHIAQLAISMSCSDCKDTEYCGGCIFAALYEAIVEYEEGGGV